MALDHDAEDAVIPAGDLPADLARDVHLLRGIFGTVAVAEVDYNPRRNARFRERLGRDIDVRRVMVRLLAAAENDVAVLVPERRDDRRAPRLGNREKMVRRVRGADRLDRDADVA